MHTQANIAEVCAYLRRVKVLAGNCAIGVLIAPEVLLSARYDAYTAAQLLTVCDFLVLDLRGIPLDVADPAAEQQALTVRYILENMQYDLIRYSPRLALDGAQTDALDYVISKGYQNWVIMESAEQTESEGS